MEIEVNACILRISNSCQWNCVWCFYGRHNNKSKTIFHDPGEITKIISQTLKVLKTDTIWLLSDNISCFDHLDEIILNLKSLGVKNIFISWEDNITQEYIDTIHTLDVGLIYFINSLWGKYTDILKVMQWIQKIKNKKQFTLSIDFQKERKALSMFLKYFKDVKTTHDGAFIVEWYMRIENVPIRLSTSWNILETTYKQCLLKNNIDIKEHKILLRNYVDISMKWDMYFHKIPCVYWSYKWSPATNIFQTKKKISSDLQAYQNFLVSKPWWNMTKTCQQCISHPFNYKHQ